MSMFSRFFGKKDEAEDFASRLVANPQLENPLSLQILFSAGPALNPEQLAEALRTYHPSMARARCELDERLNQEGKVFGLAGWGKHVIQFVGFDVPMPAAAVEACVAPSHYPEPLKARARAHTGHVILYYAGYDPSPLEQYVALAAVAGVLSRFGAIVVLNESAHTSLPAAVLSGAEVEGDTWELLRALPLPVLYCGFVKYNVEGVAGVWMRTYGAHQLGLPDLAILATSHQEGQKFFDLFDNILGYLRESGSVLAAGHTMEAGEDVYLRFREPTPAEPFLESQGELLVAEIVGADEMNQ
jgi:hypothetical protein